MSTIFKVFIDFFTRCFSFMFWFFGLEEYGILVCRPRIEPALPTLESKVLLIEQGILLFYGFPKEKEEPKTCKMAHDHNRIK